MSRIFAGVCIGGPIDGKLLHHDGPVYQVPDLENMPITLLPPGSSIPDTPKLKILKYYHHVLDLNSAKSLVLSVWLLEGKSVFDALEAMLQNYSENHKEGRKVWAVYSDKKLVSVHLLEDEAESDTHCYVDYKVVPMILCKR